MPGLVPVILTLMPPPPEIVNRSLFDLGARSFDWQRVFVVSFSAAPVLRLLYVAELSHRDSPTHPLTAALHKSGIGELRESFLAGVSRDVCMRGCGDVRVVRVSGAWWKVRMCWLTVASDPTMVQKEHHTECGKVSSIRFSRWRNETRPCRGKEGAGESKAPPPGGTERI